MLNFLFKKELQLEKLIYNYLENFGMIQKHFVKAMNICLKEGACNDFCFLMDQTHKFESRADDLRDKTNELIGWLLTPAIACFIAVVLYFGVNRRFMPEFWANGTDLNAGS